jgi:hypothetical protein
MFLIYSRIYWAEPGIRKIHISSNTCCLKFEPSSVQKRLRSKYLENLNIAHNVRQEVDSHR